MVEGCYGMADPPRFEHGFPAPEARVISRLHYGSQILLSTLTIEPVALLPRLLGGGPTAIRTRVTSSASSCDIQATLWVQRVLDGRTRLNPDGAKSH